MASVNVQEAKTHLSRLLERVEAGETIVISRAGRPIAELVPLRKPDIVFGLRAGTFELDDDLFVALDDEVLAMFDDDLF